MRSAAALALTVLAGCAGGDDEADPSAEACEHAQAGPAAAATAGTVPDTTAPDISAEHTRHDVTLVDVTGGKGGYVRLESEGGEHIVFLSVDVPLAITDADAAALDAEIEPESTCDEIVQAHHVELPVGIAFLEIGPTTETTVSILVEPAGEHAEEEPTE